MSEQSEPANFFEQRVRAKAQEEGISEDEARRLLIQERNDRLAGKFSTNSRPSGAAKVEYDVFGPVVTPKDVNDVSIDFYNKDYVCMTLKGKYLLYHKWLATFSTTKSFIEKHLHLTMPTFTEDQAGNRKAKYEEQARVYLRSPLRNRCDGLIFAPDLPPNEIVEYNGYKYWNRWHGFPIKPVKGDCTHEMQYFKEIISDGSEEFFNFINNFFSHMVQKPWEKPEVALVLLGGKGTGKTFLMESIVKPLIDGYNKYLVSQRHYYKTANPDGVFGKFTSQLDSLLALGLDELVWGGDKMHRGRLQDYITSSTLNINEKNVPEYTVANLMRVIIGSDGKWAVPASRDERRYAANYLSESHQQDHEYYGGLDKHLRNGGLAALMWEWMNQDIQKFDCRAAPQTIALMDQKQETMSDDEKWWDQFLRLGQVKAIDSYSVVLEREKDKNGNEDINGRGLRFSHPCVVNDILFQSYEKYTKQTRSRAKLLNKWELGVKLREFMPLVVDGKIVKNKDGRRPVSIVEDYRTPPSAGRVYCSKLPPLSVARQLWEFRFNGKIEHFPDDDWSVLEYDEF